MTSDCFIIIFGCFHFHNKYFLFVFFGLFDICSVAWCCCLYSVCDPFANGSRFLWSRVNEGGVTERGGQALGPEVCPDWPGSEGGASAGCTSAVLSERGSTCVTVVLGQNRNHSDCRLSRQRKPSYHVKVFQVKNCFTLEKTCWNESRVPDQAFGSFTAV